MVDHALEVVDVGLDPARALEFQLMARHGRQVGLGHLPAPHQRKAHRRVDAAELEQRLFKLDAAAFPIPEKDEGIDAIARRESNLRLDGRTPRVVVVAGQGDSRLVVPLEVGRRAAHQIPFGAGHGRAVVPAGIVVGTDFNQESPSLRNGNGSRRLGGGANRFRSRSRSPAESAHAPPHSPRCGKPWTGPEPRHRKECRCAGA